MLSNLICYLSRSKANRVTSSTYSSTYDVTPIKRGETQEIPRQVCEPTLPLLLNIPILTGHLRFDSLFPLTYELDERPPIWRRGTEVPGEELDDPRAAAVQRWQQGPQDVCLWSEYKDDVTEATVSAHQACTACGCVQSVR